MNKPYHSQRNLAPTLIGLMLALISFTSVAYGGSYPSDETNENLSSYTSNVDCQAAFYIEADESSFPDMGAVTFHNFSEGAFTTISWDFGDGNVSSSSEATISHTYSQSGTYEVILSIWDSNYDCNSTVSQEVTINVSGDDPCDLNSCVLPGDANNDGKADLNDLMQIGIGFGAIGPERTDATPMEWTPQPALDWPDVTADGVNYKHFDSDGNGEVDYQDVTPLLYHYTPMKNGLENTDKNAPRVYLDFDVDTIIVNEDTESLVTLSAGIIVGSSNAPLEDIYGMSLYFKYDSTLTESTEGVMVNYNTNSFYGEQDEIIAYGQEMRQSQQVDFGITRLDGQNISGYGRVATVNFIVIIDIIGGRTEQVVPFDVPIDGITIVDKEGNIVPVSLEDKPASVIFIKETPTRTHESALAKQVDVFPNPASDHINIQLNDLQGEYLQMYNSLGQLVKSQAFTQNNINIAVDDLSPGVYLLNVQTDKGLANKRVVVE